MNTTNFGGGDDSAPSWLSAEHDQKHRHETAVPLLGTGKIALQDSFGAGREDSDDSDADSSGEDSDDDSDEEESDGDGSDVEGRPAGTGSGGGLNRKSAHSNDNGYGSLLDNGGGGFGGRNSPIFGGVTPPVSVVSAGTGSNDGGNKKNLVSKGSRSDDGLSSGGKQQRKKKKKGGGWFKSFGRAIAFLGKRGKKKKEPETVVITNKRYLEEAQEMKPHVPRQNPCLWLFHFLSGTAIVAALCLLVTQILPLLILIPISMDDITQKIGILNIALKVYISMFCLIFILVEADVPVPFVQSSPLLQTYSSRGFLYSFLGLICVEEAYSERVKDIVDHSHEQFHIGWAAVFMQISSWLMLGTGVAYMLLGVCCLKRLRDRMKQNEIDEWRRYRRDLKRWNQMYG